MLRVYLRLGEGHRHDLDTLMLELEPEWCLSELHTLWRALEPKFITAGIKSSCPPRFGGEERWYLLVPFEERE